MSYSKSHAERCAEEAAQWVWRRDRGLTAVEQDEFSQWLAADPRHGAALAHHQEHWNRTFRLADWRPEHSGQPNPDLLEPAPRANRLRFWLAVATLPVAAALAVGLFLSDRPATGSPPTASTAPAARRAAIVQRVLEDGSVVTLNRGATINVQFTASERRVTLEEGEAHFSVAKNPDRPFIVSAHGVAIRAVGTEFDVQIGSAVVQVLVTEGRVRVQPPTTATGLTSELPMVEAGQRAVVPIMEAATSAAVAPVSPDEIERLLAWKPRPLDFTAAPLAAIVAEFNRHNPVQIVIADSRLANIKLSATFPSDNLDGFVRLLEAGFGVHAERQGDDKIILRSSP